MTKERLQVQGMHCVGCAMTIDGALEDLTGVKSATTNYARQFVDIEFDERRITLNEMITAIQKAGYSATLPKK